MNSSLRTSGAHEHHELTYCAIGAFAIQRFLFFSSFFESLLLYIVQHFIPKVDITQFLSTEFSYLMNGVLFYI